MRAFFTATVLLMLMACAGAKVRADVLVPAVAAVWPAVVEKVSESPVIIRDAADAVSVALETGDPMTVYASPYSVVLDYLKLQIDDRIASGEISRTIGTILMTRVTELRRNFGAMVVLQ